MSEDDVEKLEKIPAYVRKQMAANQKGNLKPSEVSKYTVSADPSKKIVFRENNPYLHKNID